MDYPRCKTCVWWGHDEREGIQTRTNARQCGHPKQLRCLLDATAHYQGPTIVDHESLEPMKQDESAFCSGDPFAEGAPGFLWTGPDFGCVHHESKDD